MKRSVFFNTVAKKYATGYIIMGFFVLVFLASGLFENFYVSSRYSRATSELVAVNRLETSVNDLNESVNLAYLYLSSEGVEKYETGRDRAEQDIAGIEAQLAQRFERELSDACNTIKTYIEKSEILMESLREYLNGQRREGADYALLETQYGQLQEVYGYVNLRFQNTYTAKLGTLSEMEARLDRLQRCTAASQVALMAVMGAICSAYLYKVIREVSGSIRKMMAGVNSMRENISRAEPIQMGSNDEFDQFAGAFNHMIEIIQDQMRKLEENADIKERLAALEIENLRMYSELQKSHLNFLQSRINPHFLFNTLNMISSLARIENADQCAELMEITATFLRYNLDNISKTVTLNKEMENLKDYVAIQEYRYGGRYAYHFDVDESCLDFQMPCMILQPLVENAIQHGIAMKMSGGCVWIKVSRSGDGICMEVRDNGVGMTPSQIRDVREDLETNSSSGTHIGLRNIYRRLQLFYNGHAKFEIENMNPGLKIVIWLQREG